MAEDSCNKQLTPEERKRLRDIELAKADSIIQDSILKTIDTIPNSQTIDTIAPIDTDITSNNEKEVDIPAGLSDSINSINILNNSNILSDLSELLNQPSKEYDSCNPNNDRIKDIPVYSKDICESNELSEAAKNKELEDSLIASISSILNPEQNIKVTVDNIDNIIKSIKLNSTLVDESVSNMCANSAKSAIDEIKIWNDSITSEYNTITSKIIKFSTDFILFDIYFTTCHLYSTKYKDKDIQNRLKEIIKDIKIYVNKLLLEITNNNTFNSKIANTYYDFIVGQIKYFEITIKNIKSDDNTITTKNLSDRESDYKNIIEDIAKLLDENYTITVKNKKYYDININPIKIEERKGILCDYVKNISIEPTEEEAKTGVYLDNLLNLTNSNLTNVVLNPLVNSVRLNNIKASQISHTVTKYNTSNKELLLSLDQIFLSLKDSFGKVVETYEMWDIESQKKKSVEIISKNLCDGKPLIDGSIPENNIKTTPTNLDHRTFQEDKEADIKNLKYWQGYSIYLNLVALIPKYWTVGVILPTGTRVKLPIIWIPLTVIQTKVSTTVIWLTVNGIVIVPTVYVIQWKPLADAKSLHQTLFKGGNVTIKNNKTGNEYLQTTVVGGIDINPEITKKAPFISDDLPTPERQSLSNLLYLKYLNSWCDKATKYQGL